MLTYFEIDGGVRFETHQHEGEQITGTGPVCACIDRLLPNLKPEYMEILRRVDLDQTSLAEVAALLDITTNNATVRLHRARQTLKQQLLSSCGTCATHGCLDCSCGESGCA